MTNKKLKDFEMNKTNPFAKQAVVNIGAALVTKTVKTANKDESALLKAVDKNGQLLGNTVFIRTRVVDSETFAKVYRQGFQAFADLKPSTLAVFQFIVKCLRPNCDDFFFFVEDAIESTNYSKMTIYRALGELCNKNIIARGRTEEQYYINPLYVFNGDRVTFAQTWINDNYPDYQTSQGQLKSTIEIMQGQGELPFIFSEDEDIQHSIE